MFVCIKKISKLALTAVYCVMKVCMVLLMTKFQILAPNKCNLPTCHVSVKHKVLCVCQIKEVESIYFCHCNLNMMVCITHHKNFPDQYETADVQGRGEVNYTVEEDDNYYIGAVNLNSRTVKATMTVDISSMVYDTSKAETQCSTKNGLCSLKLLFPKTRYAVLTTPKDMTVCISISLRFSFCNMILNKALAL